MDVYITSLPPSPSSLTIYLTSRPSRAATWLAARTPVLSALCAVAPGKAVPSPAKYTPCLPCATNTAEIDLALVRRGYKRLLTLPREHRWTSACGSRHAYAGVLLLSKWLSPWNTPLILWTDYEISSTLSISFRQSVVLHELRTLG